MTQIHLMFSIYSVCMIVLVILWLQSGLDKLFNFKDNYDWLNGHFSKSVLKGMVKFMLVILTILEISAGISALGSILEIWLFKSWYLPYIACSLSMLSLTAMFFGQRLAKDYGGAASLVGYMIYTLLILLFTFVLYAFIAVPSVKKFPAD